MKRFGICALFFLAFGVAGYAVFAYGFLPLGSLVHPDMKVSFAAHKVGIYAHIFASVVAITLGPFQFIAGLRQRFVRVHRWMGRAYLGIGVLVGGCAGLYMATFAFGGLVSKLGFSLLAVLWLYTGLRAFLAIRRRDLIAHRRWMVRNFSLTLAAVTLRILLPISGIAGIPFELAYPAIAWLCWVPNLLVAELFFNRALPFLTGRPSAAAATRTGR
ncbi:putative membrane protein [Lysobacter dokdonensis DS-58]|uniref:Putative membrane protein n=1 Tax=Lysobacter dokdonensis DS-58 TaxID=1300345 RepID=A0A0A2WK69_9GAMM|nr:DUF2306 domain-containing protein [Lysobacter dokdonensis]KGQ20586.1 putative membrane protein [Lysobacter dokdonensis DS-58]